ncbi:cytochrome d ubiquinol oxidase subunit II [Gordonia jinhuaensis]|uniref:Cytochrome D ubiquinol oxydase CydB n=1 Tax=Gordonia jinhuaensis TaxID=1517702 RepID=A0A916WT78_9ACTN|nr:cytochrome d ubiquinol oxidase subunit II [Gordonia jinhuaensis]GGB32449.1 putative cytochrome D ubiquinol oxydase CydB [Gordonia jinhuaensis]
MTLPEFWFCLIAFMFFAYFVLEGFDFGVGILMGFVGRGRTGLDGDTRRRVLLNTIGPVWDGNEVWLLTAGGSLFAAFPEWYATMFSGFYIPLFIILVALILRICAIEWRPKIDDARWRLAADIGIGIGSWIPPILWGVAFANVVRGVPIDANKQFTGSFWSLLNPYALLGGVTLLLVFITHGALFIAIKTAGEMRKDALRYAKGIGLPAGLVAAAFLLWTQISYGKTWTWVVIALAVVAVAVCLVATYLEKEGIGFAATTAAIGLTVILLFGSLWRNVMPSTTNPAYSLTIDNASSSHYTLVVMTWAAVIVAPVVLIYQGWTYWVFKHRLTTQSMPPNSGLKLRPETASAVSATGVSGGAATGGTSSGGRHEG